MTNTLNIDALSRKIDDKKADLIQLTQDLIRIPTLNPPGEFYDDIVHFLGDRLQKKQFGIEYFRAEDTPGDSDHYPRMNIVARHDGGAGPCVHFNSHIDVVAVGKNWTHDPFAASLVGDRIFGRGACDMKGGLAASIIAVEAYLELHPDHPGAIEISGTADEETGGYGGVAYLAEKGIMAKPRIETAEDEAMVAAWYKVLNLFSDLGELEKMYLPLLVYPEAGLEANQVLVEKKMAPNPALWAWH